MKINSSQDLIVIVYKKWPQIKQKKQLVEATISGKRTIS